jgi:hypothetical protein
MLGVGHEPELEPAQLEIELLLEVRISCTVRSWVYMGDFFRLSRWVVTFGIHNCQDGCDFRRCCDIVHMVSGK